MTAATLTIGMAHYDDYDGVWATLHALRRYHDLTHTQLLVVDNSPTTPHGKSVADLCAKVGADYVPYPDAVGTSAPRNRVFEAAAGDVVLCMDCHVLIDLGGVDAIREYFRRPLTSDDMLCGPLLHDTGDLLGTQFNDLWRAEMWGVWGSAWECPCGGLRFSPMEAPDNSLRYVTLVTQQPVTACKRCNRALPTLGWAQHEHALLQAGYTWLGRDPAGAPFEVPGQGLGLFAMKRAAWVGFHRDARGFGGEELWVHDRVRRAGGRVMCHPAVRWTHRFGRPNGIPYNLDRYAKVRNYVLEFQATGWDLAPIHEHFVASRLLPQTEWDYVLADPVAHVDPPQGSRQCGSQAVARSASPFPQPPAGSHNLDTLYDWCASLPRDLHLHAPRIRDLAAQVQHVTAIVKRREWDVYLLAARPDDLIVYTTEQDAIHDLLHKVVMATETNPRATRRVKHYTVHAGADSLAVDAIAETDMLCLDTIHHADRLTLELTRFAPSVRRYIVLRGTQSFGETAEGGNGPGLLVGLRHFLRTNPEWSVVHHTPDQYGLTVISRLAADKPTPPGVITLAANFARAVADHVADGLAKVTPEQLETRLEKCTLCDQRRDSRCMVCGCFLEPKAAMRSSACPLGNWPNLPPAVASTAT